LNGTAISFKHPPLPQPTFGNHLFRNTVADKQTLDSEEITLAANQAFIGQAAVAFGQTEVVDGVQHIGFATPIESREAIYEGRKLEMPEFMILEATNLEGL
jgi:hypothetical protein